MAIFHYDTTERGGLSAETDGERTAEYVINSEREGFDSFSSCPFLAPFLQSSITQNLGVPSKVTILAMDSMFLFADRLLHLQAVFRVARTNVTMDIG